MTNVHTFPASKTPEVTTFDRVTAWLAGGYNVPKLTDAQLDAIPRDMPEPTNPTTMFGKIKAYLSGGYNLPSAAQVEAAPSVVVERGPDYGFWAWLSGGYNLPSMDDVRRQELFEESRIRAARAKMRARN